MLQDVIHPPSEQLPIDNISSPISAQMFEFCDYDLFPEGIQNSGVTSCSNFCYDDNSSYTTNLSFPPDTLEKYNNNNSCSNSNNDNNNNDNINTITSNNLSSIVFDSHEENGNNNISSSINYFSPPTFPIPEFLTTQDDQFDFSSLQPQMPINNDAINGFSPYSPEPVHPLNVSGPGPGPGPPLSSSIVFEDDCLSSLPCYGNLDPSSPSCSFLDPSSASFLPGNFTSSLSGDGSGIYPGGILMGPDLLPQDLDFQGDNGGVYVSDSVQRVFSSGDIQALNNDNQQLMNGGGNSTTTPLVSEITNLEESTYKVGRLSVEERKEKIHRYMKKRNERNFSKKIKYACRKTLADSRPRVRGRFAKNDEFGETSRPNCSCSNLEDEDDEVVGKEEEEMVDSSSDIFAHISGVNSFKSTYSLPSWI